MVDARFKKCGTGFRKKPGTSFGAKCCDQWVVYMETLTSCGPQMGFEECQASAKAYLLFTANFTEGGTILLYWPFDNTFPGCAPVTRFANDFAAVTLTVTPPASPSILVFEEIGVGGFPLVQVYARVRQKAGLDLTVPDQQHMVRLPGPQPPTGCADFNASYIGLSVPAMTTGTVGNNSKAALGNSRCGAGPPTSGCGY